MSIAKFALDDAGRVMMTVAAVTNAEYLAGQAYLMDAACVDAGAVSATADEFNAGFRYTSAGALRVYDATAGLPANTHINQGIALTTDGQACYITSAIGADVTRLNGAAIDSSGRLYATVLDPVAWFRFNIGITETGQGVSTWADQSGEGNDLVQATDGARPPKQSDGTILFNGTDEYLKCVAFTLAQPETVYVLFKQVTWTANDRIFDGNTNNTGEVIQAVSSPTLQGTSDLVNVQNNANLPIGSYGVLCCVFDGSSSVIKVNNTTAVTGEMGAGNMSGFTLAVAGGAASGFGNIQIKEIILYAVAHDAATHLHQIRYLAHNGPVTL